MTRRDVLKGVFALAGAMALGGCAGMLMGKSVDKVTINGEEWTLWRDSNGNYTVSAPPYPKKRIRTNDLSTYTVVDDAFKAISYFAKQHGWTHFVLLNSGMNNLNGFPIDNYRDFRRYITLHARKPSFVTNGTNFGKGPKRLIESGKASPYFRPVTMNKELRNSYVSVWSVSQLTKEVGY